MDTSPDPLDELRGAWRRLDREPPNEALEGTDAETRLTVERLRAAWARLEAPEVPAAASRRTDRRAIGGSPGRRAAPWLAAAAVVAAVSVVLFRTPDQAPNRPAAGDATVGIGAAGVGDVIARSLDADTVADHASALATPQQLEVRHGRVRLILVQATEVALDASDS